MPLNLSLSVTSILEQNIEILLVLVRDCEILKKSAARLFCFTEQLALGCGVTRHWKLCDQKRQKKNYLTGKSQQWEIEISEIRIRIIH